jgi:hypothetical protein
MPTRAHQTPATLVPFFTSKERQTLGSGLSVANLSTVKVPRGASVNVVAPARSAA